MLVSALLTGGIGPWLPYQMFVAGWIGLTSGWLPHPQNKRLELLVLVGISVIWGIFYGMIMNIYFWPFMGGAAGARYEPGSSLLDTIGRYMVFYLTTSFVWDIARAVGNGLLMAVLGLPTIRALTRFRDKFQFQVSDV